MMTRMKRVTRQRTLKQTVGVLVLISILVLPIFSISKKVRL